MANGTGNVLAITKHKKKSEEEHEQIQKKRKNIFQEATYLGGQKPSYFRRARSGSVGQVHVLHGLRQMAFHPVEYLRRYSFIRRLYGHLGFCAGVDGLLG